MKSRVLAILLVVALLVTVAVFSVQAESTVKTPAEAQAIIDAAAAESFTSLFADQTETVDAPCPVCGENVTWHPLASGASGQLDATDAENFKAHYYLAESFSVTGSSYLKTVAYNSTAKSGVEYCLYLNGNTITAESLRGIWVQYGSTLNLLGETGGITAAGTGAVATNSAHRGAIDTNGEVNVYGGTYQNVEDTARSVVTMRAYDFAFNMYGGTIQSNNDAYAVYMYNTSNKGGFNAVGGTIDGGVCIDIEGADVSVDGTAVINSDNGGLDLTEGAVLTLGDNLASGADITVTVNDGAFTNESANASTIAAAGYIKDTATAKAIRAVDNKLVLGTVKAAADAMTFSGSTTAVCPYCGTVETWTALTAITADGTLASGHYYLDANTDYGAVYRYKVVDKVCINLNGQDMESTAGQVFWVSKASNTGTVTGELTMMGTGSVTGKSTVDSTASGQRGGVFNVNHGDSSNRDPDVVLNLFGGTYASNNNGTVFTGRSSANNMQVIFNMYDGQIIGAETQTNPCVAMLHAANTFNMYGGSITGAQASTYGGGVYVMGEFNVRGGNIYGGKATRGGNIYVKSGAVNVYGGSIYGGEATEHGGNIYGLGDVAVSGGAVYGGTAASNGGNIYVYQAGLNITDGNIYGGTATTYGGSIYAYGATSATISGGEIGKDAEGNVVGGTAGTNGGNLYLASTTAAVVSGDAVITGGSVTAGNGGNIGVGGSASLTLNGTDDKHPVISNGTASNEAVDTDAMGGNIYVAGTLTMNHGELLGGYAEDGGSVAVYGGTATISGGEVNGTAGYTNTSDDGGLFFLDDAAALTINGTAVLKNGKVTGTGGLVYAAGASTVTVGGKAQANEGYNSGAIYVHASSNFTVDAGFTGNVCLYGSPANGTTYGDQLVSSGTGAYTCTGEYTGTVRLLNVTGACAIGDYDTDTSTGTLWVAGVALCKDGVVVDGTLTTADAVAKFASGNYDFIRSYTDETTFELTNEAVTYVIDLDGRDITVNADSGVTGVTFLGIDTEASTSAASGAVATLGDGVVNGYRAQVDDITYVGLQAEGTNTVTVHAMKMQVTAVALRTTTGGIYYWSSYECDDTLAAAVDSFGLVYNLGSAPSTDLAQNMVATELAKEDFVLGEDIIGGIMNNILVAGERTDSDGEPVDLTNDQAADLVIYAAPYISVIGADGGAKMVMADASEDTMYLVVKAIDDMISGMEDSDPKKAQYINMMKNNFDWAGYAFDGEKWSQFTNFGPAAQ